nr:glutaminyl-peptide cyclotransferase [Tanacetum cinerariifolium]
IKEHVVRYEGHEVHNLNELEYINNEVWANIWQSDCIARISPADGFYFQNLVDWYSRSLHGGCQKLNGITTLVHWCIYHFSKVIRGYV